MITIEILLEKGDGNYAGNFSLLVELHGLDVP
jgi:hypothetical protein